MTNFRIIERSHLDTDRWDQLVCSEKKSTFFSRSWYMDAVAENWCAIVDDAYSCGMALPYASRIGVETLYTPIFVRYMEWFGEAPESGVLETLIAARFRNVQLAVQSDILSYPKEEYVFQEIGAGTVQETGSQAKRMLKKAEKSGLTVDVSDNFERVSAVVHSELNGKFSGIDDQSLKALDRLFLAAKKAGVLQVYEVGNAGGIVCLEDDCQCLYLKGTVREEVKEQGGMYLALQTAIDCTLGAGKRFDFGGSRAEGVRRFNQHLGGKDVTYFQYTIDKQPVWFKFAKSIRRIWKK